MPLRGEEPEPDVVWVPRQRHPKGLELAQPVVEHPAGRDLEQELLGQGEPVKAGKSRAGVDAQPAHDPTRDGPDINLLPKRHTIGANHVGPAPILLGKSLECPPHGLDFVFRGEQLQARSPTVVGGAKVVVAEHVRARSDQGGRVREAGEARLDHLGVEGIGELKSRDERGHVPEPTKRQPVSCDESCRSVVL